MGRGQRSRSPDPLSLLNNRRKENGSWKVVLRDVVKSGEMPLPSVSGSVTTNSHASNANDAEAHCASASDSVIGRTLPCSCETSDSRNIAESFRKLISVANAHEQCDFQLSDYELFGRPLSSPCKTSDSRNISESFRKLISFAVAKEKCDFQLSDYELGGEKSPEKESEIRSEKPEKQQKLISCIVCGETFWRIASLFGHAKLAHSQGRRHIRTVKPFVDSKQALLDKQCRGRSRNGVSMHRTRKAIPKQTIGFSTTPDRTRKACPKQTIELSATKPDTYSAEFTAMNSGDSRSASCSAECDEPVPQKEPNQERRERRRKSVTTDGAGEPLSMLTHCGAEFTASNSSEYCASVSAAYNNESVAQQWLIKECRVSLRKDVTMDSTLKPFSKQENESSGIKSERLIDVSPVVERDTAAFTANSGAFTTNSVDSSAYYSAECDEKPLPQKGPNQEHRERHRKAVTWSDEAREPPSYLTHASPVVESDSDYESIATNSDDSSASWTEKSIAQKRSVQKRRGTPKIPNSKQINALSLDVSNQRNASSPDVSNKRNASLTDVSIEINVLSPDNSKQRNVSSSHVSKQRYESSPDISKQRNASSADVSKQRNASSPDVSKQRLSPDVSIQRNASSPDASIQRNASSDVPIEINVLSPDVSNPRNASLSDVPIERNASLSDVPVEINASSPNVSNQINASPVSKQSNPSSPDVFKQRNPSSPASESDTDSDESSEHKPRMLPCNLCGIIFGNSPNLRRHVRVVHEEMRRHKCSFCAKAFYLPSQRDNHERLVHRKTNEKPFRCDRCDETFNFKRNLQRHQAQRHQVMDSTKVQECAICQKQYNRADLFKDHLRNVHTDTGKRHQCRYCNEVFCVKYECTMHEHVHISQGNLFACPICGQQFEYKHSVQKHLRCVHKHSSLSTTGATFGSPVPVKYGAANASKTRKMCRICGGMFAGNKLLMRHLNLIHSAVKKEIIDLTSAVKMESIDQTHSSSVTNNLRTHTGDKLDCSTYALLDPPESVVYTSASGGGCGASGEPHSLHAVCSTNNHTDEKPCLPTSAIDNRSTHTGEKSGLTVSSNCTHTGEKSGLPSSSNSTHRGEKPGLLANAEDSRPGSLARVRFCCDHCSRTFASEAARKRHILGRHVFKPRYDCKLCAEKSFLCEKNLLIHMNSVHLGEKPFACAQCSRSFLQKQDLVSHVKKQHVESHKCFYCCKRFATLDECETHEDFVHSEF